MDKNTAVKGCIVLMVLVVAFASVRNYCSCPPGLTEEQRERLLSDEIKEVKLKEALEALEEEEEFQKVEETILEHKIDQLTEEKAHIVTDTYCGVDGMLLVSMKRSGTTFFCSLLSNHPQLKTLGIGQEILDGKHLSYWSTIFNKTFPKDNTVPIPREIFEFIMAKVGVGFVLMGGQQIDSINGQTALDMVRNYSVIHLVRKNVLRMYISDMLAARITSSHCYAGGDCKNFSGVKIKLRTSTLVKTLEAREETQERNRRYIRERNMKHIEISYEDLSADPVKIISECLDFLRCSHLRPEQYVTNLVKRGASDLREEIENFDELVQTLKGTRFEHMIYDP